MRRSFAIADYARNFSINSTQAYETATSIASWIRSPAAFQAR